MSSSQNNYKLVELFIESMKGAEKLIKEYELTAEDYVKFNLFYFDTSQKVKRNHMIQRILFPAVYLLMPVFMNIFMDKPYKSTLPLFVALSAAWFFFYPKIARMSVSKNVKMMIKNGEKKGEKVTGKYSVELQKHGVKLSHESGSIKMKWDQIVDLKEDDERIYLYASELTAYIVKKSAFADKAEEEEFKNIVRENIEKAKLGE